MFLKLLICFQISYAASAKLDKPYEPKCPPNDGKHDTQEEFVYKQLDYQEERMTGRDCECRNPDYYFYVSVFDVVLRCCPDDADSKVDPMQCEVCVETDVCDFDFDEKCEMAVLYSNGGPACGSGRYWGYEIDEALDRSRNYFTTTRGMWSANWHMNISMCLDRRPSIEIIDKDSSGPHDLIFRLYLPMPKKAQLKEYVAATNKKWKRYVGLVRTVKQLREKERMYVNKKWVTKKIYLQLNFQGMVAG